MFYYLRATLWIAFALMICMRPLSSDRLAAAEAGADPAADQAATPAEPAAVETAWYTDYARAMDAAKAERKMLLICFYDTGKDCVCDRFQSESLSDTTIRRKLRDYVCAKLPLDAKIKVSGKDLVVLQHPTFREMLGRPGIAILDFAHEKARYYGTVVSTFPLTGNLWYTPAKMAVILDLPQGTLTQRTLIYAVRTHPEKPASARSRFDAYLAGEAESHSNHQARIHLQGHHNWDTRFHRINARLSGGLTATEVCAESWPGEHLVEAAIDCVHCWRLSSGHWSAVRSPNTCYGYDMKLGSNGIWYATGIFGRG